MESPPSLDARRLARATADKSRFEPFEIAIDQRRDVGVDGGRAPALELAVLGQDFRGDRHQKPFGAQPFGHALLVRGIHVRVQQTDGHDFGAQFAQAGGQTIERRLIQRFDDRTRRIEAFGDADGQGRIDNRPRQRDEEVVQLRPRLAADAKDVFESLRRDQRHARALALEHGIGRDGGSVDDVAGAATV